jgi:uncharacterized protein
MLSFDIRSIESHAAQVDGWLAPDDPVWEDDDALPAAAVHAIGRLSTAGAGRYYWSGRVEGQATVQCRRCLTVVAAPVAEDVHVFFSVLDDDAADDPDVFTLPARAAEIDLRPAIREQWLLAAPAYALCREDCKGLCPRCGADLNGGACDCPPETDSRWGALRQLRSDAD